MSAVEVHRFSYSLSVLAGGSELPAGYRIVPFSPEEDARAVHQLLVDGYSTGGGQVAGCEEWWHALSSDAEYDPELVFTLCGPEQRLAAVAICWTTGFVKDLVVSSEHRRKGLASALLYHVFRTFKALGAACISLKVEADNAAANSLYHSVGMERVPRYCDPMLPHTSSCSEASSPASSTTAL
jgi:ribosomal protein S18 acetylase RimI-like enzyme